MIRCNRFNLCGFFPRVISVIVLVGLTLLMPGLTLADGVASYWTYARHGQVRLIAAQSEPDGSGQIKLGLQFRLFKGWKTYWRTPGENGIAPSFDWSDSSNLRAVTVKWPLPKQFRDGEGYSLGYSREVILPIDVKVASPSEVVSISLALDYAVCRDICVPAQAAFQLDFPMQASSAALARSARDISRFEAKVPRSHEGSSLRISSLKLLGDGDNQQLQVFLESRGMLEGASAIIELAGPYRLGEASIVDGMPDAATIAVPVVADPDAPPLSGRTLNVIAWDGAGRIVERALPVVAAEAD